MRPLQGLFVARDQPLQVVLIRGAPKLRVRPRDSDWLFQLEWAALGVESMKPGVARLLAVGYLPDCTLGEPVVCFQYQWMLQYHNFDSPLRSMHNPEELLHALPGRS